MLTELRQKLSRHLAAAAAAADDDDDEDDADDAGAGAQAISARNRDAMNIM